MARKKPSRRDRSPSPLLVTLRSIATPVIRFCTPSTDTLDRIVELCAGPRAITRIERGRSTRLIQKLSKALDPEHVGDDDWAEVVGGRYTGIREATPSLVTPWKDPHFGVIYRYRLNESPEAPVYKPAPGSGSLYGLLFSNPSGSRPSSPPKHKSNSSSSSSHHSRISFDSIIEGHSEGRTNLANRYCPKPPEVSIERRRPSCPELFPSDGKKSHITAMLYIERGESEQGKEEEEEKKRDINRDWVDDEANVVVIKGKASKPTLPVKATRAGKRPIKFPGGIVKDKSHTTLSRQVKKSDEGEKVKDKEPNKEVESDIEGDCAVESCDSFDPRWIVQRKRYS